MWLKTGCKTKIVLYCRNGPFEENTITTEWLLLFIAFQSILSEFNDLRAAVERHIARMKCFANDLEKSSQKLEPFGGTTISTTSVLRCAPKVSAAAASSKEEYLVGAKTQRNEFAVIGPSTSNSRWPQQFDDIEVISYYECIYR